MGDLLAEISLSGLLHLGQNHGADLLGGLCVKMLSATNSLSRSRYKGRTYEFLKFMFVLDLDGGLAGLADKLEWPVLLISLDLGVVEVSANQTYNDSQA